MKRKPKFDGLLYNDSYQEELHFFNTCSFNVTYYAIRGILLSFGHISARFEEKYEKMHQMLFNNTDELYDFRNNFFQKFFKSNSNGQIDCTCSLNYVAETLLRSSNFVNDSCDSCNINGLTNFQRLEIQEGDDLELIEFADVFKCNCRDNFFNENIKILEIYQIDGLSETSVPSSLHLLPHTFALGDALYISSAIIAFIPGKVGHYIAFVKSPLDNLWYKYNDFSNKKEKLTTSQMRACINICMIFYVKDT